MSGSSLDGLDLAVVEFELSNKEIKAWNLLKAKEVKFPKKLKDRLAIATKISAKELALLDHELGIWMGMVSNEFIGETKMEVDYIASHGHTIFHMPSDGFTKQIGSAAAMVALSGTSVICDFRSIDLAHGGQGAPLAPIVEHYLYPGYELYLNLGGIANISLHSKDSIIAFDVCPANQILNKLAAEKNLPFDEGGCFAANGKLNNELLEKLEADPFLAEDYPKSLDNNTLQEYYFPLFDQSPISTEDKLATAVQFIANSLAKAINKSLSKEKVTATTLNLFVSGGGTFNTYLIEKIKLALPAVDLHFPSKADINFKEAILMALLGLLRILDKPNSFASVTGASKDTVNGSIYKS